VSSGTGAARRKSKVGYWVIIAITVAAMVGIWVGFKPTPYDAVSHTPSLTPITPSSVVPSASPSMAPQVPELPQDPVAQALPTGLTVTSGGDQLLSSQEISTTSRVRTASGDFILGWPEDAMGFVDDPGVPWAALPGSDIGKNTIVLCHANANPPMVCNPLGKVRDVETSQLVQIHPVPKSEYFAWLRDAPTTGHVYVAMCQLDTVDGMLLNSQTVSIWEFALISSSKNVGS